MLKNTGLDDEESPPPRAGVVVTPSQDGHKERVAAGNLVLLCWTWFRSLSSFNSFTNLLFSSVSVSQHFFRYSYSTSVCFNFVLWNKVWKLSKWYLYKVGISGDIKYLQDRKILNLNSWFYIKSIEIKIIILIKLVLLIKLWYAQNTGEFGLWFDLIMFAD